MRGAMSVGRAFGIAITLSVALAPSAGAPIAAARSAASLGATPPPCTGENYEFGACVVQTRLGTLTLSPHLVHAGEVLTATVALAGNFPIRWPDVQATPSGSFAPELKNITPCGPKETTCEWRVAANAPSSSSWQFLQVGITNSQGTGISREYFAVIGKDEFELSGHVTEPSGAGLAGVRIEAKGPEDASATTDAGGRYSLLLKRGSYTVTPVLAKRIFQPSSTSVSLSANRTADFQARPNIDQVTISATPTGGPALGLFTSSITVTDTNPLGEPVEGASIKIEPPLDYATPAIVCDSSGRLAYPTPLNDGSILGASFERLTDGAGQIHMTALYGTVPGDWPIEAGEAAAPLSQYARTSVTLAPAGGAPRLPEALTAQLISAAEHNDANVTAEPQRNLLAWLGKIQGELGGIGFLPVHSLDATGAPQAGIVLFANSPPVREHLLDYLTGHTTLPPGEEEAVVIDIASVRELRIGTTLAGHPTDQIPYRLPPLDAWANGTVIQISAPDQGFFGKEAKIPIAARGRPSFGFATPSGAEALLYGYGPYPPAGGGVAQQSSFNSCVSRTFATSITPHSPVTVTATAQHGTSTGLSPSGKASVGIPGSIVSHSGRVLREITLPEGSYSLRVTGTGSGPATLVLAVHGASRLQTRVFHFRARRGAAGTIALRGASIGSTMRFGSRTIHADTGLALKVSGLPRLLHRRRIARLRISLRARLGGAAGGASVRVSGVAGRHSASTDGSGRLSLTLRPGGRGRIVITFAGPGYQTLTRTITVR